MDKKVGRNDPCPCGSGKKYKNCHMGQEAESKKTYTEAGKRKFTAKVITSTEKTKTIFQTKPMMQEAPSPYVFLKFKQTTVDYQMSAEPVQFPMPLQLHDSKEGFSNPHPAVEALPLPDSYEMTSVDYRVI